MKHWTIRRKLYSAVGVLVALFVVTLGLVYRSNKKIEASADATAAVVVRLQELSALEQEGERLLYLEKAMVASAYARNRESATRYQQQAEALAVTMAEDHAPKIAATLLIEANKADMTSFENGLRNWRDLFAQIAAHVGEGRPEEAQKLSSERSEPAMLDATEHLHTMQERLQARATEVVVEDRAAIGLLSRMLLVVFVIVLGAGAGVFVIVQGINRRLTELASALGDGAAQVAAASSQVAGSSQSLSQGATEQAASLQETSASMVEMASMTRTNAEHTREAAALMTDVDARVTQSNSALAQMVDSMNSIQESSAKVSRIIKTIDEIAFQTNILALNAAVEAARAGEAGAGFAVVADEVRNLAQRSAQAAKDTAVLIEEAIADSTAGTQRVQQVGAAIAEITGSVQKVKGLVDEVSLASRQQTEGIEQVSQAVNQMEKVTQSIAATAEESAAASEELNAQAETTRSAVEDLQAMVDGARRGSTPPPAAKGPGKPVLTLARRQRQAGADPESVIPLETGTFSKF